jgi:ribose transport system substrate-binding protein
MSQHIERSVPETHAPPRGLRALLMALLALALIVGVSACGGSGGNDKQGSDAAVSPRLVPVDTVPTEPFDPNVKPGLKPDVPRRFAFPMPSGGELFTGIDEVARQAAEKYDVDYVTAQADGDSPKQFQQLQSFLARGTGAIAIVDAAPPALQPLQREAMTRGAMVICGPFPPCTLQGTTDQYATGHQQGATAVRWIKEHLGGKAEVAMFSEASSPGVRPRYDGVRDALAEGGSGIRLVADVPIKTIAPDEGFKAANTVLQRHPGATVWIAPDSSLIGALSALEAAGKADTAALFGSEADAQALKEVAKGGPYKSTQGFPYAVLAYAWVKYAADWFDGKSVPMLLRGNYVELSSKDRVEEWNRLNASAAEAFAENEKTHKYLTPLGNTSYQDHRYLTVVPASPRG